MIYRKTVFISLVLIGLLGGCWPKDKPLKSACNLRTSDFEASIDGKHTFLHIMRNGDIELAVTNYGARIVSLPVPDKNGSKADVILGFNSINEYLNANEVYHGAIIGRVGNRIDKGKFKVEGKEYTLPINNDPNHLHGGPQGFHTKVWDLISKNDTSIVLAYLSKDGEMGYPGNVKVQITYYISSMNEVGINYKASTDKATPVNLTNHAFFNLSGEGNGSINGHLLKINADYYTPVDTTLIPLGENKVVEGTPFDFRDWKAIGQDLIFANENRQLINGFGYDHNFVLKKQSNSKMELAATVVEPKSGRKMEVYTEEPGLQFYGGNFFNGSDIGKSGRPYNYRESFALETQHFPDSPNQDNFPDIILEPGETYSTTTIYKFTK